MSVERRLTDCLAPAKLNLFLHVIGRRTDGYHLLQSVMQLLDYGDILHFTTRSDGQLQRMGALPGVTQADDLVLRAARLLQNHCGVPHLGADIILEKRLPMGAGLGGGSSDAATTLIALNHLWQTGLNRRQLMQLGLQLGADIPFFIFGRTAFAEGIGEQLQTLPNESENEMTAPDSWYVVLEPGVIVPTPAIFSAKSLTRDSKPVKITDFSSSQIHAFGKNDLQAVAVSLFPQIGQALDWLGIYGTAKMTGSGACVFCAVETELAAQHVVEMVPSGWKAWKAKALIQHTMNQYVSDEKI